MNANVVAILAFGFTVAPRCAILDTCRPLARHVLASRTQNGSRS